MYLRHFVFLSVVEMSMNLLSKGKGENLRTLIFLSILKLFTERIY